MAAWIIDNFGVRENHFFSNKWFDTNVTVDENGNIDISAVPGKNWPLPSNCLSDYNKNNRQYKQDQLITEFCNLNTFTNYRIYAQDCKPFAYTQTDINAAKCGYLVPLPQPFLPATPWGSASYGFYAYHNICDDNGVSINVRIYKRNYTGASIKINNSGASPVILSYKNSDDNKFTTIRACELQLTLVADGSFDFEQFYTQDEREFKIQIIKDGITKFFGFLTPAEVNEEFIAPPYDIVLRATDGLGALKKISYPLPVGGNTDIRQNFIEIICYCLAMTNLNLDLATICNLYETKMHNGASDDPLIQASVNPLRFTNKGAIMNCYDILNAVCLQFGAFLVQDNGTWFFVRQSELANNILRKRLYKYTGFFLKAEQLINKRVATCNGNDIKILDDNPVLRISNAYKRAEVSVEFGDIPFILYNGSFEIFDGSNFAGWTKYGGIQVSRIEKQIITTSGKVGSGNYALQFDELANNNKYFEASKIQAILNDKITLSFNVSKTILNSSLVNNVTAPIVNGRPTNTVTSTSPIVYDVAFKIRIKIGQFYLTNPAGDANYTWVAQLATCTIAVNNPSDIIDTYLVSLEMPEAPANGDMVIQLFGFIRATPGTYYPINIDNIAISKSTTKTSERVLYVNQQDGFYTNKPDLIELLFGDFSSINTTQQVISSNSYRGVRLDILQILNNQYAIYTVDGSYSTGWYEYGSSTNAIPIGLSLARSIMKAYQIPFRFLQSSFLGNNISYLDIFNVYLSNNNSFNDRIFALLSGDFDLKTGELKNANYVEIFNKSGKTIDIIIHGNSGDPTPPFTQNPNPTIATTDKIFTHEFKQEFK